MYISFVLTALTSQTFHTYEMCYYCHLSGRAVLFSLCTSLLSSCEKNCILFKFLLTFALPCKLMGI